MPKRKDKSIRFRLPGPRAWCVDSKGHLFPFDVLAAAIRHAAVRARACGLPSHLVHPGTQLNTARASYEFSPEGAAASDRAALVTDCFLDELGEAWIDFVSLATAKGGDLAANVRAGAPLGTSFILSRLSANPMTSRQPVEIFQEAEILTFDLVTTPAALSTLTKPILLTDTSIRPDVSGVSVASHESSHLDLAARMVARRFELRAALDALIREKRQLIMREANTRLEALDLNACIIAGSDCQQLHVEVEALKHQLEQSALSDNLRVELLGEAIARNHYALVRLEDHISELRRARDLLAGSMVYQFAKTTECEQAERLLGDMSDLIRQIDAPVQPGEGEASL